MARMACESRVGPSEDDAAATAILRGGGEQFAPETARRLRNDEHVAGLQGIDGGEFAGIGMGGRGFREPERSGR